MTTVIIRFKDEPIVADPHHVIQELYGVRIDDGKGGFTLYPWHMVVCVVQAGAPGVPLGAGPA